MEDERISRLLDKAERAADSDDLEKSGHYALIASAAIEARDIEVEGLRHLIELQSEDV